MPAMVALSAAHWTAFTKATRNGTNSRVGASSGMFRSGQAMADLKLEKSSTISVTGSHVVFQLAELLAAPREPRQIIAANLGDASLPESLDELFVAFTKIKPGFVAAVDQVSDADPADIPVQLRGVADIEKLLGLQRREAEVSQSEQCFCPILTELELFPLLAGKRHRFGRLLRNVPEKRQLPFGEDVLSRLRQSQQAQR